VTCEAGIRVLISRGQEGNRDEINKTEAKEQNDEGHTPHLQHASPSAAING
jgi:hypothetical protein